MSNHDCLIRKQTLKEVLEDLDSFEHDGWHILVPRCYRDKLEQKLKAMG
jgi:hypothetical protein